MSCNSMYISQSMNSSEKSSKLGATHYKDLGLFGTTLVWSDKNDNLSFKSIYNSD